MKLSDFVALSFDCYGTLIDWESGIHTALASLLSRANTGLSRDAVLETFARFESRQQALTPAMTYSDLLAEVHGQLAAAWGVPRSTEEDARFGRSIGDWPPFPDTVEALRYLKQHFRLVILSNVDRTSFLATNQRLGIVFDAIYTAQDVGSYKPDPRNFAYLLDRLNEQGVAKEKLLHVAQSLFHDHVPANAVGLASAWIDRRHDAGGWGATAPVSADVRYDFRFTSLNALAEAHRAGG
jgi:2-haloalkanoic acid dehalogenase type II